MKIIHICSQLATMNIYGQIFAMICKNAILTLFFFH